MQSLKNHILCFFLFVPFILCAQANTLIRGNITQYGASKIIELNVNHKYLDGELDEYFSNILEDGSFAFAIDLEFPQLVSIKHGQSKGYIYLEPGDTLHIHTDGLNFQKAFVFSDKSGSNNRYLVDYYKRFPAESNPFKMVQYQQGIHWYDISPEMDSKMRNLETRDFLKALESRKESALKHLIEYQQLNANALSSNFISFIETEIIYDWAYHVLAHGHIYKKIKNIEQDYFNFLNTFDAKSDQIGNYSYRKFLLAMTDKLYLEQHNKEINPYNGQYKLAEERLLGIAKNFIKSEMISKGFAKKYLDETIPIYQEFLQTSESLFEEKVTLAFEKSMQNAIGTMASNFVITNKDQKTISLNSLKGKTIYLNFWASWCSPCVRKMVQLKKLEETLKNSNIEFVHISFDKDVNTWEQTIRTYNFEGIHALAIEGIHSELAKAYNVKAIPQYFLINRDGQFAAKPTSNTIEELKITLNNLSQF